MSYIARSTITVGHPRQLDRDGQVLKESTLKTIAAGEPVKGLGDDDIESLLAAGHIEAVEAKPKGAAEKAATEKAPTSDK